MHKTEAGERRKILKRESRELAKDAKVLQKAAKTLPEADQEAQRLQKDADKALEESEALKLQPRLEDLTVWEMEKTKSTKKGTKTYTYWMVSWREGEKVRNVHLGSSRKMDAEEALQKARKMKAEALGRNQ
jgi:regulator of replication initiation timing